MLSFKPTFSLSFFTFTKRLFSSSSLSAIRVVSSAYLRLLIFLPAILIQACASSSLALLMMYSAYKLNILPRFTHLVKTTDVEWGSRRSEFNSTTPSSNNTREDSIHGHHQMVNTEIRLIIFFAAKDGGALYCQQKQDQVLTVAQTMNFLLPNSELN